MGIYEKCMKTFVDDFIKKETIPYVCKRHLDFSGYDGSLEEYTILAMEIIANTIHLNRIRQDGYLSLGAALGIVLAEGDRMAGTYMTMILKAKSDEHFLKAVEDALTLCVKKKVIPSLQKTLKDIMEWREGNQDSFRYQWSIDFMKRNS